MEAKRHLLSGNGRNGQVTFDGESVVIKRQGFMAFYGHGVQGDRRIPLTAITSVQFKEPGTFFIGHIQFTIQGGGHHPQVGRDPNTVLFPESARESFAAIRTAVEKAIFEHSSSGDEKICPQCAEAVKAAAKVCRFCGHTFE